ncbi:hypothetical protein Cni_G01292 [Canna indica]|uniref:Clp ATPase C-terminal domain-containing protein n=1 Tax=Canna indica TaxID=4628 RepID=A0AAQ3JMA8_9LILI|nr:hypothetical protein Cni_G01292 [Canna indica]
MQLDCLNKRLIQRGIYLGYTPAALDLLGNLGFDANFGARPVKRVIQQMENEIALHILRGDFKEDESMVVVDADESHKDLPLQKKLLIYVYG